MPHMTVMNGACYAADNTMTTTLELYFFVQDGATFVMIVFLWADNDTRLPENIQVITDTLCCDNNWNFSQQFYRVAIVWL